MQSFVQYTPTEVVFGKDTENQVGELVKKYGGTRVLIVYGGGSVVQSGLLARVEQTIQQAGIAFESIGGVKPNPLLSFAREGVQKAIAFGADFILAVGGGSAIDTAKAIAHGLRNPDTDIWTFWVGEQALTQSSPVGVVLTIPAAGSEMSNSAVLTNDEIGQKRGLSTDWNRPMFAVMNPELTFTLPKFQLTCGIVDIMMHTMERYFTHVDGNEMTDEIAEGLLRVTIKNGTAALTNQRDYQAMSELMWCGSLSHNGLTGLGGVSDFAVHQLGHELSARFDSAHGASLSAVWGDWAKYCYSQKPQRFAQYAKKVWGIEEPDTETAAQLAIDQTVAYFRSLDMPTCFSELGIGLQNDDDLIELADRCVHRGKRTVGNFRKLGKEDALAIYQMANR